MKFAAGVVAVAGLASSLHHRCHAFTPIRHYTVPIRQGTLPSALNAADDDGASNTAVLDPPTSSESEAANEKSLTQRIMEQTSTAGQTGGAGGVSTWDAFQRAEG